jgi:hypothetical protein
VQLARYRECFFVAFLTVCCYHGASSLGSGQPPRPDDTKTNSSSGIATVGQGLSDEEQQSTTPSGESTGDAQDTSLGDPNSTGEAGAGPKGGGSETEPASKSDPLRSRFWQWLMTNRMIALYVVMGVALITLLGWFFLVRRKVVRTRLKVKATMLNDPELTSSENGKTIPEFLIVFNWTQKVLYLPTIVASLLVAIFICVIEPDPTEWLTGEMDPKMVRMIELIGGVWFGEIRITFKRGDREPVILYVWRIGAKAKKLEELGTKMIVT